jgi:hypothetical protein
MIKTPFISVKGKLLWLVIWLKEAVWIGRIFLEWDMYIIYIYIYIYIYIEEEREREKFYNIWKDHEKFQSQFINFFITIYFTQN